MEKRMGKEIQLAKGTLLISKTDPRGMMSYCNRSFMETSGYNIREVLGQPHSLVRHPDTPRGIFKRLWDTIQQGHECALFVKNTTKCGDFYWCFSVVTPDYDTSGSLHGYFAVQRPPHPQAIKNIEKIYTRMRTEERNKATASAPEASLQWLNEYLKEKHNEYDRFMMQLQRGTIS